MEIPLGKMRTTGKLSTDMTEEEMKTTISKMTGIPIDLLPPLDLKNNLSRIREESGEVDKIIADYKAKLSGLNQNNDYRYDELYDIGKFILFANRTPPAENDFQLIVPGKIEDYPDFILTYQQKNIGIEHTRLMHPDNKALIQTVKYYFNKAQQLIASEFGHLSKTVNVFIDYTKPVIGQGDFANRKFTLAERKHIPNIIADYIRSELTGRQAAKPEFINRVTISSNKDSRVDIELAEMYFTQLDFQDLLLSCIEKKELRADKYRNAVEVNHLWLLIVIDDVSSFSGFNLESPAVPEIQNSKFDCILVFEKFGGEIHVLFSKEAQRDRQMQYT